MLRSLFAGVTGLQAHQVAMDIESNNIANVNTIGYKYSRANFADLLAQTNQIATAPQGSIGGKNAVQIGLGSSIGSVTKIMTQGSIQNTDKNTDVAIQGDGFFIVSADGGSTYKYSRSGDFKFDASGNLVDNSGNVVQGWVRNADTGQVDSSTPISNITVSPGLTTPANATTDVTLKANLDSGATVETFSVTNAMDTYNLADYLSYLNNVIVGGGTPTPQEQAAYNFRTANTNKAEDMNVMFNDQGQSLVLQPDQGVWISYKDATVSRTVTDTESPATFEINGTAFNITPPNTSADENAAYIAQQINAKTSLTGVLAIPVGGGGGGITLVNDNSRISDLAETKNIVITNSTGTIADTDILTEPNSVTAFKYQYATNALDINDPTIAQDGRFTTTEQLRLMIETHARVVTGAVNTEVTINDRGQFKVISYDDADGVQENVKLQVTSYRDPANNISANQKITDVMQALNGVLVEGSTGQRISQGLTAATHSGSIDIFDSLGSKHTLRMEFRKTSVDAVAGSTWSVRLSVPEPGEINTVAPLNEYNGQIRFTADGALSSYTPTNINFTAGNGSMPNQNVNISFGTSNGFDGMTSFDATSGTSGISQDGFPGGDLVGMRIDQSGTIIGSFSNGRSFGLAQIAMAKFTNNEGLMSDGGNVYLQSANSGDPIIGTAATAGRGFMQSSALEASNVDLSKSLTNLIIIQRGYQANGKTITTSDTLLETLLGIKR
ncbi:MAG: flagellar hook protein FlgE [Sulfuricurvum sp.]|nr:flagellar hook protein FlgE [Sulfuricurvum sp.]